MAPLMTEMRAFIAAHRMIAPGAPVVVAVSGGPDSLGLLHALAALQAELGITLHVGHLDHMIRGAESAAEAQFVADLVRRWELPATIAAVDVPALARQRRANLHATARDARYAFLARVALAAGAQAVAVAHHADDQAETVLLHLLRGAGPAGLSGMRPVVEWEEWAQDKQTSKQADEQNNSITPSSDLLVSPSLIRPLLTTTRAEIERYCAEQGLEPRRDPSNLDLDATRNRIRHDLMPRLIEYNPHIVAALGRTAAVHAEEHAFVQAALGAAWPDLARERAGAVDFAGPAWRRLHPALQREAIRQAHARLARNADRQSGETLGLEHVEQARALIERGVGRRLDLPGGVVLTVGYGGSFTLGDPPELDGPQLLLDSVRLPDTGCVQLDAEWMLDIALVQSASTRPAGSSEIDLDADRIQGPLIARRRRPGDWIRLRRRGSRRLQDLFVDLKVPRALRDAWPIVATSDAIIWVVGLRVDDTFLATPDSRRIIQIRLRRAWGGPQALSD